MIVDGKSATVHCSDSDLDNLDENGNKIDEKIKQDNKILQIRKLVNWHNNKKWL